MTIYTTHQHIVGYVAAACGGGKTHAFVELVTKRLADARFDGNFCYVGVSMALLAQVEAEFKARGINVKRIDMDTHDGPVMPEIVRWLKSTNHKSQVLLITQKAYFDLPYFHHREDWRVYIDEVPQVGEFRDVRLPRGWRLLADHLHIARVINKRLGRLTPKNPGQLKKYLEQPRDDTEEIVRSILADVLNTNKIVFVDLASWERMVELGRTSTKSDEKNKIYFLTMLAPEAFHGTTVMGADVKKSMLWHWLMKCGAAWKENQGITRGLRYHTYPEELGRRLHVKYVTERRWSKRFRNEQENSADLDTVIEHHLEGSRFLLVQNKDSKSTLPTLPGCTPLSSVCHGLNRHQDHTKIAFTCALNLKPKHASMLNDLGISNQVQRESLIYSALHQSIMRTALRDPNSTDEVEVIVPDRWMADAVARAVARAVGGAWITDVWEEHEERFRVAEEDYGEVKQTSSCHFNAKSGGDEDSNTLDSRVASSSHPHPAPQDTKSLVSLTMNQLTKGQDGDRVYFYDTHFEELKLPILKLVKFMRLWHQRVREQKRGILFQLAEFRPDVPRDCHLLKKVNLVAIHGLVLDFDGGTVSPDEFERIHWWDAGSRTKLAFMTCNTYSTSPATPNKFRVIMPYNGAAQTVEEHQAIFDSIEKRLAEAGHPSETSGLDRASRNAVQRYYVPCTNAAHPESAFFRTFGLRRTDEFLRYAIKPGQYAALAVPEDRPIYMVSPEHGGTTPTQVRALEKAEELMAEIEGMTEGRRKLVFDVVTNLHAGGRELDEIEDMLTEWAPDDRVEQHVRGAVQSWRKHKGEATSSKRRQSSSPAVTQPVRRLGVVVRPAAVPGGSGPILEVRPDR